QVISQLKFTIDEISNVKVNFSNISFQTKLMVANPTNIDFGATLSSAIAIRKIRIYNIDGKFLGFSNTNIFNVHLPSNTSTHLDTLRITLSNKEAISEFSKHLTKYLRNDYSRLYFEIDVVAFDNTLTLTSK